jgi:hypothetical protein
VAAYALQRIDAARLDSAVDVLAGAVGDADPEVRCAQTAGADHAGLTRGGPADRR